MNIKKLLGKRLQEIRKSKKLTQEHVAEAINVETSSISNIENGRYFPSAENLEKLLKVLNINPSEIFLCESYGKKEDLISEMLNSMQNDEKLTKMMYKFYLSVKF